MLLRLLVFKMMRIILLLSICVGLINARCPNPSELSRKYDSFTFMCARVYEHSHHLDYLSCQGAQRNVYNRERTDNVGHWWNDRVSSLVVSVGCTLDVYWDDQFRGSHRRFTGKVPHLSNYGWNDKISSWTCSCEFTNAPLRCTPYEEYQQIATCSDSSTCRRSMKKGLYIGYSVTEGRSLSNTAEVVLGATFKDIFSNMLAASTTTEYSWRLTDISTFSTVRTTTVSCDVPSGRTVRIRQAVGHCGDTVVYTSHYICQ